MTWIRWETTSPQHEMVGALAEVLNVRKAEALGLFTAACSSFGEYRKDGMADLITDTTLEGWALWEGKRGRFAATFRALCVERREGQRDAPGVVRGWWRQQALLREQERSRVRPGQGSRSPPEDSREAPGESPRVSSGAFPVPSRGNVDGNVDERTTTTTTARAREPTAGGARHLALAARMTEERYRSALEGYLRAAHDPPRLLATLEALVSGLHGPGGQAVTPDVLGAALNAMALAGAKGTEKVLAAFVRRELEPDAPPRRAGIAEPEDEFIRAGKKLDAMANRP